MDQPQLEQPSSSSSDSLEYDPTFRDHVESLGLSTVAQYRAWCDGYGFDRRSDKSPRERRDEYAFARQTAADARLAKRSPANRPRDQAIDRYFTDGRRVRECRVSPRPSIMPFARERFDNHGSKAATCRLLAHLSRHSKLISGLPGVPTLGAMELSSFVEAVFALARHCEAWIRPPETWFPDSNDRRRQFGSLVRHLTAAWPVPEFLDAAWFLGRSEYAVRRQGWFVHIGRGANIRHADLPIAYTKKMAHHFLEAPADLSIDGALRYGQVVALGGDEALVRPLVATHLGNRFEHDEYWAAVLRWFIKHPRLDKVQIGPIVEYLEYRRSVAAEAIVARRQRVDRSAATRLPEGNLRRTLQQSAHFARQVRAQEVNPALKDRTAEAIVREAQIRQEALARARREAADRPTRVCEWPVSGIAPFRLAEKADGTQTIWTIRELLSSGDLKYEGARMHHCVGTYAQACLRRSTSIWTMELEQAGETRKVLTIEVDLKQRAIREARCKYNKPPGPLYQGVLRRWAAETGLGYRLPPIPDRAPVRT